MMNFGVISLFPDMFDAVTRYGVTARAVNRGLISLNVWNPRDFTHDVHRTVDDRPFGGGPGMLMKPEPLVQALRLAKQQMGGSVRTIYLSPQGKKVDQESVSAMAQESSLLLLCGRYEGVDERVIESEVDEEWSLGDFVLSGGELPAMCLIDAVARQIPGVLGHEGSAEQDSFMNGLLDCPHYTRPEIFEGHAVPQVLLSGHHQRIDRWRLKQALGRTWLRRSDLLETRQLSHDEQVLLDEFKREFSARKELGSREDE